MIAANQCHNDDAILEPGEYAFRQEVSGRVFTATVPALVCPVCGEKVIDGPLLLQKEREVAAALAREGPVDGDSFRFMRTTLRLRAADLAALLDVAPETISKWENGKNPVLRTAWLVVAGHGARERRQGSDATPFESGSNPSPRESVRASGFGSMRRRLGGGRRAPRCQGRRPSKRRARQRRSPHARHPTRTSRGAPSCGGGGRSGSHALMRDESPGVLDAGEHVFALHPRVALEDGVHVVARREHPQHVLDRESVAANDRLAAEDGGVDRDAVEEVGHRGLPEDHSAFAPGSPGISPTAGAVACCRSITPTVPARIFTSSQKLHCSTYSALMA